MSQHEHRFDPSSRFTICRVLHGRKELVSDVLAYQREAYAEDVCREHRKAVQKYTRRKT